jgi:hypothetical protein
MKPHARDEGILVRELPDETLVYDLARHKAHCLNRTAAAVWRLCDGTKDEAALAALVGRELGARASGDLVRLALQDLGRARLLRERMPRSSGPRVSRRRAIERLGQAVALPLIVSIVSPTAAQAASCRLPTPVTPAACNAGNPNALGCCCTNNRICANLGGGGCSGAAC